VRSEESESGVNGKPPEVMVSWLQTVLARIKRLFIGKPGIDGLSRHGNSFFIISQNRGYLKQEMKRRGQGLIGKAKGREPCRSRDEKAVKTQGKKKKESYCFF
jgi:hypothetical protein